MRALLQTLLDRRALYRATLALAPVFALTLLSGRPEWLIAAIVPVAMLIALDRSGLAPLGVLVHGMVICAGFMLMMASMSHPLLFVATTVLLGMGSIAVTARGKELRSLGNFTFIPALYLACERAEGVAPAALVSRGADMVPFLLAAAIPVLLIASVEHYRALGHGISPLRHFARWTRRTEPGERNEYIALMITVALAVGAAAILVEWKQADHGQWIIWSAASVVTGSAASARQKFQDRLTGAVAGVPLGVLIGLLVPHAPLSQALVVFAAMLTLVCIRPYTLAFGTRCACAAMAFVVAGQPWLSGGERLINVAIGSFIGLICALAASAVSRHRTHGRHAAD